MEEQQITKKLDIFLEKQPFTKECQVLYFMAEVRKIIDVEKAKKEHNIKVYCAWALHSELNHKSTLKYFRDKFEPLIDDTSSINEIGKIILANQSEFFKLNELKEELKQFLRAHGLSRQLTDDSNNWKKFRVLLSEILRECSITFVDTKIKALSLDKDCEKYIYRFHLRKRISNRNIIKIKLKLK